MTREKWFYIYCFCGGFALALFLAGIFFPAILIALGIAIMYYSDRATEISKRGKK